MSKKPPPLVIQLTAEDYDMVQQFAHRCGTSMSQVAKIGIFRLMGQAAKGEVAMLPEDRAGIQSGNA